MSYRKLFIMPKRKLNAQLQLERLTGRAENPMPNQFDIYDRIKERRPRYEEMKLEQDWPNVWPAAASFKASVVPLRIRMGTRKRPEKRAPFKTVGNTELLKIPNFLHLSPLHIERHCKAIKKFCTDYPDELKCNEELVKKYLPLTVQYSDYVHQGTSLRDMRARIVTVSANVDSFKLNGQQNDKLLHLLGSRYDPNTKSFTIVTDRCPSRIQNRDYANYLLTALYFESKKVEKWENMAERVDCLRAEFDGSTAQKRILEIAKESPTKIEEFAKTWFNYRNQPETPETAREYENAARMILGIKSLKESNEENKQMVEAK